MNKQASMLDNKAKIIDKLHALDFMLDTLGKVHKENEEKQEDLMKKISTRKLILVDELYKLISPLS